MESTQTADQTVPREILKQLGGNRFIAMTGAKGFITGNNDLSFSLPGTMTKNRINRVQITLTVWDNYAIKFMSVRRIGSYGNSVVVEEIDGIYFDGLQAVIADRTGLRLSL